MLHLFHMANRNQKWTNAHEVLLQWNIAGVALLQWDYELDTIITSLELIHINRNI